MNDPVELILPEPHPVMPLMITMRCRIHRANGEVEDHVVQTDALFEGIWEIAKLNPGDWVES